MVIKGAVDAWRIQRIQAWKIVEGFRGSKDLPQLWEFYSLPYDDELKDMPGGESLDKWYDMASKELSNFNWPAQKN